MKSLTSITLLVVLALAVFVSGCGTGPADVSNIAEIKAATPAHAEVVHELCSDIRAS